MIERREGLAVVPAALVVGIFVMLFSGRTPTPGLPDIELRFVLLIFLLIFFLLWKGAAVRVQRGHRWGIVPWLVLLVLGLYLLSSLWSESTARTGIVSANTALTIVTVMMVTELSQYGAERVRLVALYSMLGAGVFFALGSAVTGGTSGIGRAVAFGGGPNVFVRFMIWGAIAAITLAILKHQILYLAALPLVLLFALLSASRGGLTAGLITAALMVLILVRRIRPSYVVIALLAVPLLTWLIWSNDQVRYLMERRFNWAVIVESGYGSRDNLWSAAMDIFSTAPIFGQGMDSFYALARDTTGFPYPHNILLELASDLGVLGLATLALVIILFVISIRRDRVSITATQLAMIAAAAFTFFASMFSGDFFDARLTWIFAVLAFPSRSVSHLRYQAAPVQFRGNDRSVEGKRAS